MRLRKIPVLIPATRRLLGVASVGILVLGCSGTTTSPSVAAPSAANPSGAAGTTVAAILTEFKIELDAASTPAGSVSFALDNKGTVVHEFVVFQTDLAVDKLPLTADGTAVEEGGGLTLVDEVEDIEVGATPTLAVDLPAAHYVLICNVPAHYTSGMRAEFTTN
jgi:uncharacterized cupredoxin-like copper-binding protein